ncbi:caspase b [Neoarius graeffei]|uniref:caspase b n=1 Tax=Neoarius graeffei TaxID=443677 RepID=UPI00298D4DE4|nr:caspase b [Neoarius graeffei]
MCRISHLILNCLDELFKNEFKKFKWSLMENNVQGFTSIPRGRLENADKQDLVDLMVDQYGDPEAANITVQVLESLGKNDLASKLQRKLQGQGSGGGVQAGTAGGVGVASSSSSSQAGGVSLNISADGQSTLLAPVLSGGTFNGPVNINYTSTPQ